MFEEERPSTSAISGDKFVKLSQDYGVDRTDTKKIADEMYKKQQQKSEDVDKDKLIEELNETIKSLKLGYAEIKTKNENNTNMINSLKESLAAERAKNEHYEEMRKELIDLRDYVHLFNEEEETVEDKSALSVDEMLEYLKSKALVMLGGNQNWLKKIKQYLPDMKMPSSESTFDVNKFHKSDMVFIFTDTISHGAYYKYMNALTTHDIPYTFIHGVNINKNIEFMYNAIKNAEKSAE